MPARSVLLSALLAAAVPARAGLLPEKAFSDKAAGTVSASFLKIPVGARAEAMGETGTGVGGTLESLFWNPAGLASLGAAPGIHATFGYNKLLEGAGNGYLAAARPLWNGVAAAGLVYLVQDEFQTFNVLGDATGSVRPSDVALSLAFARPYREAQFGLGLKIIRSDLGGVSAATVALDGGMRVPGAVELNGAPVDFGLSLRNLGPGLSYSGTRDPLPLEGGLGFQWRLDRRFRINVDAKLPVDQTPYAALGAEGRVRVGPRLAGALRLGYNLKNTRDIDGFTGVTGGFGLRVWKMQLDYAFVPFGELGKTHRVSLSTFWSNSDDNGESDPAEERRRAARPPAEPAGVVAVLDFDVDGVPAADVKEIQFMFESGLLKGQRFRVVERRQVQAVMKATRLQNSGATDSKTGARIGSALNAEKIFLGTVGKEPGGFHLDLRLVAVGTHEIVASERLSETSLRGLKRRAYRSAQGFR